MDNKVDISIFCIGESATWGIGAKYPEEQGYPKFLEKMLKVKYPKKNIRCFYDQTIGQNTSEILWKLPKYIETYRPKVIILMVGANNWWNLKDSNLLLFSDHRILSRFLIKTAIFLDNFQLWKLLKWLKISLGFYNERWEYYLKVPLSSVYIRRESFFNLMYQLMQHEISEMIEIIQANNVKVIMCSYPVSDIPLYMVHRNVADR
jgi:hypothetical protein